MSRNYSTRRPDGDHPSPEAILDYVSGMAAPEEEARMEAHISGCSSCRREIELQRAIEAGLRDHAVDAGEVEAVTTGVVLRLYARRSGRRLRMLAVAGIALCLFAAGAILSLMRAPVGRGLESLLGALLPVGAMGESSWIPIGIVLTLAAMLFGLGELRRTS